MNINIKATNIELTDTISNYINKRLSSLEKFIKDEDIFIYAEVGKTTNHHKQGDVFRAEFNIDFSGIKFYAFSEKEDIYEAIDIAKSEIIRKITDSKERKQTLFRRGATSIKKMIKGISKRNPVDSNY